MADTKETTLSVRWSKREGDLLFSHPAYAADGHLLYGTLCADRWRPDWDGGDVRGLRDPSFVKELEARGYDITTLRFSVRYRHDAPAMLRRFRRKAREWFKKQEQSKP